MSARPAAVIFILVTVLLDLIAIGLILPVQPKLVAEFMGGDTARGALMFGIMSTLWALMQLLFQPVIGALSDRYGRRPVLLLSNLGLGLDYLLMAWAPTLAWLFVGRVLSGIAAATYSTATAYIADITPPEKRATEFGKIGLAFGIGFVVGPALGGMLGESDPRLPFWIAAGLSLANALYGFVVLPESLAPENRKPFSLRSANPIASIKMLGRDRVLTGVAAGLFLFQLAHTAIPNVMVFYLSHRYAWTSWDVGVLLALAAITAAIVQGLLIRPAIDHFGARKTLLIGLVAGALGFLGQAFAITGAQYMAWIFVMAFWGYIAPAAQQIMTSRVGANEQGTLQGANGAIASLAHLLGPIIFTNIFAASIAAGQPMALSGISYVIAALMLALAVVLVARTTSERS